ncbi:MAG: right-handed parallel beta-helix repeat-containing protein, partial [Thermoleophilaceae bacterium]|nr:right-handed parallel beta-helix repeat-containing protein [Thermoleophilaceae bacterium]
MTLPSLNIFGVRRLVLRNLTIEGDVHCERCVRLRLRRVRIRGGGRVQEGLKVNQSAHVVVERSDISGAQDNAIDFVAVQHALIRSSRIH